MKKIILIDNYDSFTYNLANLILYNFNGKLDVVRNDELSLEDIDRYNAIVISPGPKKPKDAIFSNQVINNFYRENLFWGFAWECRLLMRYLEGKLTKLHTRSMEKLH